jgi:plastocyanin
MLNSELLDDGSTKAVSKTIISVIAVIVLVVVSVAGVLYVSTVKASSSSGNSTTCSLASDATAVQVSIISGASISANGPGYNPDSLTLIIGTNNTVAWTNYDSAHHTVTTSSATTGASLNSGDLASGKSYTCTFTTPGTYKYYCTYHSWMTGSIIVIAS